MSSHHDNATWQHQPTGRLMIHAFRHFEEIVTSGLQAKGFNDLNMSHLNVIRQLDPAGLNLVDLAKEAAISKQAISKIAADLVLKGYVTMAPDPLDGRAKRVQFTARGKEAVATAICIVKEMEKQYLAELGSSRYHDLREALHLIRKTTPS